MSDRFAHEAISAFRGPRVVVSARISAEAVLSLELAAAERGIPRSALLAWLLETWAELYDEEDRHPDTETES